MWLRNLVSIFLFSLVKILSLVFFKTEVQWVGSPSNPWAHDVRLFVFLNHTSLFEPLFISAVPFRFIFWGAPKVVVPGADTTLRRAFVGTFFKLLCPKMVSITRKRDSTWDGFLSCVVDDSLVVILPEGRMMRRGGFDKDGGPMTVRGGISDILEKLESGGMLIGYSGGLHHVQAPGEWKVRLFQRLRITFERTTVEKYKEEIQTRAGKAGFKTAVIQDLEARMKKYCPNAFPS